MEGDCDWQPGDAEEKKKPRRKRAPAKKEKTEDGSEPPKRKPRAKKDPNAEPKPRKTKKATAAPPWKVQNAWADTPAYATSVPDTPAQAPAWQTERPKRLQLDPVHETGCAIPARGTAPSTCSCWTGESMDDYRRSLTESCRVEDAPSFGIGEPQRGPQKWAFAWSRPADWFPAIFAGCPEVLKKGARLRVCPEPEARTLHLMLADGRMGLDVPLIRHHPDDVDRTEVPFYIQSHYCSKHDRFEEQHLTQYMPNSPIVWARCS